MRISDWSSDVCSSDLLGYVGQDSVTKSLTINGLFANRSKSISEQRRALLLPQELMQFPTDKLILLRGGIPPIIGTKIAYFSSRFFKTRSEEHTSELQSLMRISYAVFCVHQKTKKNQNKERLTRI